MRSTLLNIIISVILVGFLGLKTHCHMQDKITIIENEETIITNKVIPKSLEKEIIKALSYFPELTTTSIAFRFKDDIVKSTMQAQPKFSTLLKSKGKREYYIFIRRTFQLSKNDIPITNLPTDVLVGWFGHELGHIMDYESMSNSQLIVFGLRYISSKKAIKIAERKADSHAVKQGMLPYLEKTKSFLLDHADIPEIYKTRIRDMYPSPEEIAAMITEHQ